MTFDAMQPLTEEQIKQIVEELGKRLNRLTLFNMRFSGRVTFDADFGGPAVIWKDWTPTYGGFTASVPTSSFARYCRIANTAIVDYKLNATGTSNATSFTIGGLPFSAKRQETFQLFNYTDNGVSGGSTGIGQTAAGSTTLTLYTTHAGAGWNNALGKGVNFFRVIYEINL